MEEGNITYNLILAVVFVVLVIGGAWLFRGKKGEEIVPEKTMEETTEETKEVFAVMKTNMGEIKLKLFPEEAPKTVDNFIKLSKDGFYNGVKFHRVIKDFMIQSGDPNSKDDDWSNDGIGGPGYSFEDEINEHKLIKGSLAMANSGPNTNGSQFFIVTANETPWLDGKHTVFGQVITGMEAVRAIEAVEVNENDHPLNDIVIEAIEINE
jgi:peptidyl-prolyl cis-trans isomerase B (cyclophilin B)